MKRSIKKADDTMMRNEAIWDRIVNKLTPSNRSQFVKDLGSGAVSIGGNLAKRIVGIRSMDQLMGVDWVKGELSFLVNSKWAARSLQLQLNSGFERVIAFDGDWYSGNFNGASFFGKFHGGTMRGKFATHYSAYLAPPYTFIDGTIDSFKDGVLGFPKMDVMALDASSQKKEVYLFELKVGFYCNLLDNQGITHSFKVTKSCDNTSMDIELQEETGHQRAIRIPWSSFQPGGSESTFKKLSSLQIGKSPSIPFLFANDRVGPIVTIEISTKPTSLQTTVDTYKLDSTLLRPLTHLGGQATVHLLSPQEIAKFGEIYQSLSSNGMQMHLQNIIDGIKFGIITGWNGYPHLRHVFNEVQGEKLVHPKYAESMEWMDEFVQFVILRMVKSRTVGGNYVPNEAGKNALTNKLSSVIGKAQQAVGATSPKSSPSTSGTKSGATGKPRPPMVP